MYVKELSTSYTIGGLRDKPATKLKLMQAFSTVDYQTEERVRLAYLYDEELDILRIPRISHSKLLEFIPITKIEKVAPMRADEIFFKMKNQPTDIQKKVFDSIEDTYSKSDQVYCDMITGSGKTYLATYVIHRLQTKAIIFAQTNKLREQWAKDIMQHTELTMKDIAIIQHATDFLKLDNGKKIIICTHHNLRNLLKINGENVDKNDILDFNEILHNMGIGIKVFDEADLETSSLFKIDMTTNVHKTLYLSATRMKSIKEDDAVYQLALHNVDKHGAEHFESLVPNRDALLINFKSKPGKLLYPKAMTFGNDFNNYRYCKYMLIHRPDVFKGMLSIAYKKWQELLKDDKEAKLIIYVARAPYCFIVKDMINEWFKPTQKIGVVNSLIDNKYRAYNFNQKIIVTTIKSLGRGVDLRGIRVQFDTEVYSSESMFKQQVGRTGRMGGSRGYYIGIYDFSYMYIHRTYMKKQKIAKSIFDKVKPVQMDIEPEFIPETREEIKRREKEFTKKWWKYLKDESKGEKKNG